MASNHSNLVPIPTIVPSQAIPTVYLLISESQDQNLHQPPPGLSKLMSGKGDVRAWVREEEYFKVMPTATKAPCWALLSMIQIPVHRNDCQLVLDMKRFVVGYAMCTGCNEILATKLVKEGKLIPSGTTHLNKHAEKCLIKQGSKLNDAQLNFQKLSVKISKEDQILIKESQSALVSSGIVCLKSCDSEVFHNFSQIMLEIGSKYKNPEVSRVLFGKTAVRDNIMLKHSRCKSSIAEKVRDAETWGSFSIVTEMTTDQLTQKAWTDLTFIWAENYEIKRGQYACRHWEGGRHTAENIKAFLYEQFAEIGIVDITRVPIVTDSDRNILAAVSDMQSQCCMAHILHNVLSDAWKNAKAHNIEIHNLDVFSRNLVTFVKASNSIQEHLPMRLKHGGKTRPWRSLYQMFHSISSSYDALEEILGKKSELMRLQSISKPLLEEVLILLEPMCSLWDKLEVGDTPSLQNCMVVGHILMRNFSTSPQGEMIHPGIQHFKTGLIFGLVNKFFTSLNPLHSIALFLDITLRDFNFIENETDRQSQVVQAKAALISSARDYAHKHAGILRQLRPNQSERQTNISLIESPPPKKQRIADPFAEFRRKEVWKEDTQSIDYIEKMVDEEVTKYIKMACPHATSGFNPLQWWGQHSEELPILAGVSCTIYCIPATSSESECHFSKHKSVLTARRATLAGSAAEALVVVSSNMASGVL